jgi:hypothetical protein
MKWLALSATVLAFGLLIAASPAADAPRDKRTPSSKTKKSKSASRVKRTTHRPSTKTDSRKHSHVRRHDKKKSSRVKRAEARKRKPNRRPERGNRQPDIMKKKHHLVPGTELVSAERLEDMEDGTHRLRTDPSGNRVSMKVRDGKIGGLAVKDKKGRPLAVKVYRKSVKRDAEREDRGVAVSARDSAGAVIIFAYYNPAVRKFVLVVFPLSWVAPEVADKALPDPGLNVPPLPQGGDEGE